MKTRTRTALGLAAAAVSIAGCSAVLGLETDRHVVAAEIIDAGVDSGLPYAWRCENDPVPDAAPGPLHLKMFVNDVSTASSQNSFAGNPIPGASVNACSTLDIACATPVGTATSDDAGIALMQVPSGFSGYYELRATGFTSAIAAHTPQLGDEYVQEGMANVALIAAGGGLAGVTLDPNPMGTAIVSVLDCDQAPAVGMQVEVGAPGATETLVYLANSLPSASATETDTTGSAIIYNVPAGTLRLTASFAADHKPLRAMSTIARVGWVTFVQMRLDQSYRVPL